MPEINERFITLGGNIPFPREIKNGEALQVICEGAVLNFERVNMKQPNKQDGMVDEVYVMKFHSIEPIR